MAYSAFLQDQVVGFVSKFGADIVAAITDTGLYFSAVVAQKCLESGYCNSELCSKYNNFAGIRNYGSLPDAGTVYYKGHGDNSPQPYATYDTPLAGFKAYVQVLRDPTKDYIKNGVLSAPSPEQQILRTIQSGYDPTNTPQSYLASLQGMLDCARNVYKLGRINSNPFSAYISKSSNPFIIQ